MRKKLKCLRGVVIPRRVHELGLGPEHNWRLADMDGYTREGVEMWILTSAEPDRRLQRLEKWIYKP